MTAAAVTIIAAALIVSGQGNLAAIVAAGAGGVKGRAAPPCPRGAQERLRGGLKTKGEGAPPAPGAALGAGGGGGCRPAPPRQYRLAANELFRELIKTKVQAADSATAEAARHRVEVAAWHRRLEALAKEAREHLASLKRSGCQYCWYAPHLEWELKRADRQLAKAPMREQVQLIDLLPKEDVDEFYSDTEEVNTTDTATAEE